MSINIEKELAFLQLAIEEEVYPKNCRRFMTNLIHKGAVFAPYIFEAIIENKTGMKQLVNESHRDFEDNSDSKTSCVTLYKAKGRYETYKGCISSAKNKIGYIRAAVYNGCTKTFDYFLIPPANQNACSYNYQGNIHFNYVQSTRTYTNDLELYRKKSLKEVCKKIKVK